MNKRDIELAKQAEAYADYNFKGEPYWREAYESRLIDLIRADEREACMKLCKEHFYAYQAYQAIRARGNT